MSFKQLGCNRFRGSFPVGNLRHVGGLHLIITVDAVVGFVKIVKTRGKSPRPRVLLAGLMQLQLLDKMECLLQFKQILDLASI